MTSSSSWQTLLTSIECDVVDLVSLCLQCTHIRSPVLTSYKAWVNPMSRMSNKCSLFIETKVSYIGIDMVWIHIDSLKQSFWCLRSISDDNIQKSDFFKGDIDIYLKVPNKINLLEFLCNLNNTKCSLFILWLCFKEKDSWNVECLEIRPRIHWLLSWIELLISSVLQTISKL